MSKTCIRCNTERDLSQFFLEKKTQKYAASCRPCNNAKRREYLAKPEVKAAKLKHDAEYRAKPENKEKMKQCHKNWYKENREEKLRKNYENEKKRLKNDSRARMLKSLRVRLKDALNGNVKADKTLNLLGCDMNYFRKWIEYQFMDNIMWDNYGSHWHLDHVKPCASFNLSVVEEQKQCFHWSNIRPLEKSENMAKSATIDKNEIEWQKQMVEEFLKDNPLI